MARAPTAACDSLRATAELLRLPSQAVATAAVFLHRYRESLSDFEIPPDTPLRTNDLLNAIKYVFTPDDSDTLERAFPGIMAAARQPRCEQALSASGMPADVETETGAEAEAEVAAAPEGGFLAGDAYYAAKEKLIMDEQVLLRVLRFSINIEHPHKYLLNMCHLLGCSRPLAHLATCLVNDSLGSTQLCVKYSAAEVAAGALHLASLLLGVARDMPFKGELCWWDALGFSLITVEEVGHALFDVLLSQRLSMHPQ